MSSEKVTRRRRTVADRLAEVDALIVSERERLEKRVQECEAALEAAKTTRRVRLTELQGRRDQIVRDALAAADEIKRQVGDVSGTSEAS